jgi:hypothetical protein
VTSNLRRTFPLSLGNVLDQATGLLAPELGPDHGLNANVLSRYIAELVLPEYPRSQWGVWTRIPTGQLTGLLAPMDVRLRAEAVDWAVLAQMIHRSGLRERWRLRWLFEVCVPNHYSVRELRELWDAITNVAVFLRRIRQDKGLDI